jgi:hypothetical protein
MNENPKSHWNSFFELNKKEEIVKVLTKEEKYALKKRPSMIIKGETYVPKVKKAKKRLTISEQINLENKKAEE